MTVQHLPTAAEAAFIGRLGDAALDLADEAQIDPFILLVALGRVMASVLGAIEDANDRHAIMRDVLHDLAEAVEIVAGKGDAGEQPLAVHHRAGRA